MSFQKFACWQEREIGCFIRTEATTHSRAAFFAVHLPINDFEVIAAQESLRARTEAAVLEQLRSRRHALALVEGEPGSGKSHLIQWLKYQWPAQEADYVVLVPRSDGSLLGTLERLRANLGPTYAEPLRDLGQVADFSEQGKAMAFLAQLITTCRLEAFPQGSALPLDAEWLDENQAWRLLDKEVLKTEWNAPQDLVRILSGAEGQRDQQIARFIPSHLEQMIALLANEGQFGNIKARRFFLKLRDEHAHVAQVAQEADGIDAQLRMLADRAPISVRLLRALNTRCQYAVQGLLGMTQGQLQHRFLQVRQRLGRDGKRLVLLLEDITNLQGVDRPLLEALLPDSQASQHGDLCDLVAVLGLTPYYYSEFLEKQGNIRDRIHLHLRLTSQSFDIRQWRTHFLGEPRARHFLAATYLNAIRLGESAVNDWAKEGVAGERPNRCAACGHMAECHDAFGGLDIPGIAEGPVGLYPFTAKALDRFWNQMRDPQAKRSLRTPRALLRDIVSEILHHRQALVEGKFPNPGIESSSLEIDAPSADVSDILASLEDEDQRQRLQRAIAWWGELSGRGLKTEEDGHQFYAGVPRGVMAAFGLPWPGDGVVTTLGAVQTPRPKKTGIQPARPASPPQPAAQTQPPQRLGFTLPQEWVERCRQLNLWASGKRLSEASCWQDLLSKAVRALSPEALGVKHWLWHWVVTKENVFLQGSKGGGNIRSVQLGLPPDTMSQRGLCAMAWLEHGQGGSIEERLPFFAELAEFQSWLGQLLREHLDNIYRDLVDLLGGDPQEMCLGMLLAGSWLSGRSTPDDEVLAQWRACLSDERPNLAHRQSGWAELGERWSVYRENLADLLCETVRVGQKPRGRGIGENLLDPSILCGLSERWAAGQWAWPQGKGRLHSPFDRLQFVAELSAAFAGQFSAVVETEDERLRELAREVYEMTGGDDAEAFLADVEAAFPDVLQVDMELVSAANAHRWHQASNDLKHAVSGSFASPKMREMEKALRHLSQAGDEGETRRCLMRVLRVNPSEAEQLREAVEEAAKAVREAYRNAQAWIADLEQKEDYGLDQVADILEDAAQAILQKGERR